MAAAGDDRHGWIPTVTCSTLPGWTGGAALITGRGTGVIVIAEDLLDADREAARIHETVHAERRRHGRSHPVRSREERLVNEEVAQLLLDLDLLERWCASVAEIAGAVTPEDVADEFHVAVWVGQVALELINERRDRQQAG